MDFIEKTLKSIPLPKVIKIHQYFGVSHIEDEQISEDIRKNVLNLSGYRNIKAGQRIAVTGGSRGIHCIQVIIKTVCDMIKEKGASPFIVPAMGSHGGATQEGQLHMLALLGITEETMGVPIKSSMETVQIGSFDDNRPIYMDKFAHEADGIVLINRIKAHTSFKGEYESGLMKMMAIGLGKQQGAQNYHQTGFENFSHIIESVGKKVIELENIVFGLGIIENGYSQISKIACMNACDIPGQEKALLRESYEHLARPFFRDVDVMICKEIGKNISGTGCDSNISGRFNNEYFAGDIHVTRLGILELSPNSYGNANGMGLGDFITKKIFKQMDLEQMYANALTTTAVSTVKIPMILPDDSSVFKAAVKTSCIGDFKKVRICIIENSKNMATIYISENMVEEAQAASCEICGNAIEIPFDADGNLLLDFN